MSDRIGSQPVRTESDVDEKLQSKIVDYTTPSQGMEVDSDGDAHVKAKLRDDAGDAFGTSSNPVFVAQGDNSNVEIHDFDEGVDIAKDASDDHLYSPANNTKVKSLHLSASGLAKFEVKFGPTAGQVLKYVYFNSASKPSLDVQFPAPIELAGGADSLTVTRTNLDNQAQSLYSTVNGQEF